MLSMLELYYVSIYTCIIPPLYKGFSAYLPPVHVLYIVAFGPLGIQVAFPNSLVYEIVSLLSARRLPVGRIIKAAGPRAYKGSLAG